MFVSKRLYKAVRGFAMACATAFIILLLIPSGPEGLCVLSISCMSRTSCSEISVCSSLASVLGIKFGICGTASDIVEIDVKYSFKHSFLICNRHFGFKIFVCSYKRRYGTW